jgi:hypothetical protein
MARHSGRKPAIFVLRDIKMERRAMPHEASIFESVLKPVSRRAFDERCESLNAEAYDKSLKAWPHLLVVISAQLSGMMSLRQTAASWSLQTTSHYHLGTRCAKVPRSTLSDANKRRPPELFASVFTQLSGLADRSLRRDSGPFVRLIDASPIPLSTLFDWRASNGRINGAKLHLVFDPDTSVPLQADITPANINDVSYAAHVTLQAGFTYVFDKGYNSLAFWQAIADADAVFVTRPKKNAALTVTRTRRLLKNDKDAGALLDEEVRHDSASKGRLELDFPMRRLKVQRSDGKAIEILTNDMTRTACEISALYRQRWQIELLFRWIKQHLKIRRFIGRSENAVKLQIFAALIAYVLLRIAAAAKSLSHLEPIRLAELVSAYLFTRKPLHRIDKPPERYIPQPRTHPNQMSLFNA